MRSWWGKSSSKEEKRKANKESFIDAIQRKLKIACEEKTNNRSEGFQRGRSDTVLERVSKSRVPSRSPSPSTKVLRCQSFVERPRSQPLPLPGVCHTGISCSNSGIIALPKPGSDGVSKPLHCLPHPRDGRVSNRVDHADTEGDLATASVSSGSSSDSDDPPDSFVLSPLTSDYENGNKTGLSSPSSVRHKDVLSIDKPKHSRETLKPANHSNNNLILATSPKEAPLSTHVQNLHIPHQGAFCTAPDSSMSSPSRSPMRAFGPEQFINSVVWAGKACSDVSLLGSGHCSSPGSGHSGQNSIGGDISGQLFWPNSRCSPECSPIPSPRMSSPPGPSSRIHSGSVSPLHSWAGGITSETSMGRPDGFKQQSHRLPLPPITISRTCPFSPGCSTTTSPSLPRSPNRAENPTSPGSCWKKGRLLGKGVFGDVYLGFNSESGEMCAMKEVILFSDDAKSKESAQQLRQEIALLSRLRHPNIVQYYGSKVEDDKLYIYLEYVSGGSIYKLLQDYGQFGEIAIRNYTQQILSGLSYLHGKNTVHRDIKGANILVDPSGRIVKLADFGMAKHINGQSCPLSFKGSPYWMAPEVIMNSNGCNPAVDIWSLGCTVLEMATTKPPWSQYEAVPAMFKIGKSKELPTIPDHLSNDGKDFVRQCLQRDPSLRPSAAKLLAHPFVSNVAPLEKPISSSGPSEATPADSNGERSMAVVHARKGSGFDSERVAPQQHRGLNSDVHSPKNISCSVSPIGSPLLRSRSPQHGGGILSPSPISSSHNASGSSTPLTGDSGVIPIHHSKQPISLESIGMNPRSQNRFYTNSPQWEPDNGLFRGVSLPSHLFQERTLSNNGALVSQLEQYGHGCLNEHYEYRGQPMLSDRVSQQLLGDHVKLKSFMGLNASSSARGHTNRT